MEKSHWARNNATLYVVFTHTLTLLHAARSSTYDFCAVASGNQLGLGKHTHARAVSSARLAAIQNVADAVAHLQ